MAGFRRAQSALRPSENRGDSSTMSISNPPQSERPTKVRYWVIVLAVSLAVIQYLDRVAISSAAAVPAIRHDLRLTDVQMGWVFGAFGLAYAIFDIPGGYLGDRIGPRKV